MESLFSLLDSFGLNEPSRVGDRLATWGDEEFQRFFDSYTEAAKSRPLVVPTGLGSTDVFPDSVSGTIPLELIRQLCVYVNRFYIHDPVLSLEDDFLTLDTKFRAGDQDAQQGGACLPVPQRGRAEAHEFTGPATDGGSEYPARHPHLLSPN